MKIIIDCSQIPIKKTGVGVYAIKMIESLVSMDKDNIYMLVVQNDDTDFERFRQDNVRIRYISKRYRSLVLRAFFEQCVLPFISLNFKADIIHSLHYSFPLITFGAKKVVTVHDLTFFVYPEMHTATKRFYFKMFIKLAAKLADGIAAVSNSTSSDITRYCPNINPSLIKVTPLACNIPTKVDNPNLNYKYITFIGTLEPRKNITKLMDAYSEVVKVCGLDHYRLVVVGKKGWFYESIFERVNKLQLEDKIKFTGFVTDEEKFSLLKGSTLFIYPSYYEGFGLPVLEAMAMGVPTITSNISSMPEVAGEAAILISPDSVKEITAAIVKLLNNQALQEELSIKGKKQASKFSWNKTALETLNLYQNLI